MKLSWTWVVYLKQRPALMLVTTVAGLALGALLLIGPLRWTYDHTVVPVGQVLAGAGVTTGDFFANLGRIQSLAAQNQQLEVQNRELKTRLAADAETQRDNITLRRQLGLDQVSGFTEVGAEVVSYEPDSYRQFITIDKGSKAGLQTGMAVTSDGVLVGLLSDVKADSAKIVLVTDPEFRLVSRDQDTGALGVLQGKLGSGLDMGKIDQTDKVAPGDTVVSSGLGGLVPAGILVGEVQSVNQHVNAVFQSAQVSTDFSAGRLRFVFVVKPQ